MWKVRYCNIYKLNITSHFTVHSKYLKKNTTSQGQDHIGYSKRKIFLLNCYYDTQPPGQDNYTL